jgi:hypothetical protein
VQAYRDLWERYEDLRKTLREIAEVTSEHDDWEQLNQQKLNSTNEER